MFIPTGGSQASFPADVRSVSLARRWVRDAIDGWPCEDVVDAALLLTSEIVTNAIVHGGSEVALSLAWDDPHLHVAVRDDNPVMPVLGSDSPLGEGGRGMILVDQVSEAWGSEAVDGGKVVWFRLVTAPVGPA